MDKFLLAEIEELNVTGSRIIRNIIIVPINNTLLYVEPIYQIMINEENNIPINDSKDDKTQVPMVKLEYLEELAKNSLPLPLLPHSTILEYLRFS